MNPATMPRDELGTANEYTGSQAKSNRCVTSFGVE